jgi:hypothetical protein
MAQRCNPINASDIGKAASAAFSLTQIRKSLPQKPVDGFVTLRKNPCNLSLAAGNVALVELPGQ